MISLQEVSTIHQLVIERFGGSQGIRDKDALLSAVSRPFQTFDGKELYENALQKAAALVESILINHPFVDGNKRTGYVLLQMFLINQGVQITASQQTKYDFIIEIASGKMKHEEIVQWLNINTSIARKNQ